MTSTQRLVVIILILVNVVIFGAIFVVAFSQFNASRVQAVADQATLTVEPRVTLAAQDQSPAATATPGAPTLTPTASQPTPTATLVVAAPSPVPASTVVLDPGWKYYQNVNQGFALALPAGWQQLDLNPATFQAALDSMKAKNPEIANMLGSQGSQLLASGFKFFGLDATAASAKRNFVTNVNVLTEPLAFPVTLDTYAQLSLAQLEQLKSAQKPITTNRVKLGSNDAVEFRYHLLLTDTQGKSLTTSTLQYALLRGNNAYIITLTTTSDQEQSYSAPFAKIAQSFRWLNTGQ